MATHDPPVPEPLAPRIQLHQQRSRHQPDDFDDPREVHEDRHRADQRIEKIEPIRGLSKKTRVRHEWPRLPLRVEIRILKHRRGRVIDADIANNVSRQRGKYVVEAHHLARPGVLLQPSDEEQNELVEHRLDAIDTLHGEEWFHWLPALAVQVVVDRHSVGP